MSISLLLPINIWPQATLAKSTVYPNGFRVKLIDPRPQGKQSYLCVTIWWLLWGFDIAGYAMRSLNDRACCGWYMSSRKAVPIVVLCIHVFCVMHGNLFYCTFINIRIVGRETECPFDHCIHFEKNSICILRNLDTRYILTLPYGLYDLI